MMLSTDIFEIALILMSIVLICNTLVWKIAIARKKCLLKQLESLNANTALKILVDNIQQHRGMLNATLSGDDSFAVKITQTQKVINTTLRTLNQSLESSVLNTKREHLNKIQQSWEKLYPNALSLSKEKSLQKHVAIIKSTLFLMTNIAEENQLVKNNCYPVELVDIIWHRIPNTAEALGKTRAAGSGIAATGICGAIERIKVGFLIKHIYDTTAIVEEGLNKLQHDASSDNNKLLSTYKLIQSDIHGLLDTMKHKLLESATPQITASLFFEQATVTLNQVYDFFDQGEGMINQKIMTAIAGTESTIKRSWSIFIFSALTIVISTALIIP